MAYDNILATASFVDAEARAECERRLAAAIGKPASEYDELLARIEAGNPYSSIDALEALRARAKRIAELERNGLADNGLEKLASMMLRCSLATGHGETIDDLISEMEWQIKERSNRAEAAESRLAAIDAYRGEAEKVADRVTIDYFGINGDAAKSLFSLVTNALLAARMEGAEAEREACAKAVEKRATEIGRQECCGIGTGDGYSPPECCADPLFMISDRDALTAIRARKGTGHES